MNTVLRFPYCLSEQQKNTHFCVVANRLDRLRKYLGQVVATNTRKKPFLISVFHLSIKHSHNSPAPTMDIKSPSSLKSMCLNALANNSITSAEKAAELLNLTHSLTISIGENRLPFVRTAVSGSDIEMIPSVILLANKDGTTRLPVLTITANNVLFFDSIDSVTVEKLLEFYPDLTNLTFVNYGSIQNYVYLENLLTNATLKNQLYSFKLIDKQREPYDSPGLFNAINNLAALKDLNLDLSAIRMYDLQVLATLKTFKYNGMMRHCHSCSNHSNNMQFLMSVI